MAVATAFPALVHLHLPVQFGIGSRGPGCGRAADRSAALSSNQPAIVIPVLRFASVHSGRCSAAKVIVSSKACVGGAICQVALHHAGPSRAWVKVDSHAWSAGRTVFQFTRSVGHGGALDTVHAVGILWCCEPRFFSFHCV